jgi:hypothetical protein
MGGGGIALPFLTSGLDGGEWSASRPCRFTPGEIAPSTHWRGGWVGPRAGLDYVEKRKILHLSGFEHRPLSRPCCTQSLYRLSYPGSPSDCASPLTFVMKLMRSPCCLYVAVPPPHIVARQRAIATYIISLFVCVSVSPPPTNILVFCEVCVVSRESRRLVLPTASC